MRTIDEARPMRTIDEARPMRTIGETYANNRWPQRRWESRRRAGPRKPPRWPGTCRCACLVASRAMAWYLPCVVWRRACLARHRLDAARTRREVSNALTRVLE